MFQKFFLNSKQEIPVVMEFFIGSAVKFFQFC